MTEKSRTAEEAARAAPISLPPGGFEHSDLERVANDAAKAKPGERDAVINAGLERVVQREDEAEVPGMLPGHKLRAVERVIFEGEKVKGEKEPVGRLTVTETIQVFDPAKADEEIAAAHEAIAGPVVDEAASAAPASAAKD